MRIVIVALAIAALLVSADRLSFAQPASGPKATSSNEVREGRRAAVKKKRANCRTEGEGKGMHDEDLRDHVAVCVQEARLACLKEAIGKKIRGRERVSYVDKCLGGD